MVAGERQGARARPARRTRSVLSLVVERDAANHKAVRLAFMPPTPRALLEELCESTWAIVQDRHPFRDLTNDSDLKHQLRRKLFILAENSDLEDLDGLQRSVLEALARGVVY